MRMPPDPDGHGGSQRAWRLVEALLPHGKVHFVLLYRGADRDCVDTSLAPLEPLVASVTRINLSGWQPVMKSKFGVVPAGVCTMLKMRSQEAPRLPAAELKGLADRLPTTRPDIVFAGRLCTAVLMQSLMDRSLLSSPLRVVDFDDIMSKFRVRQLRNAVAMPFRKRVLNQLDARIISAAEARIARRWHGISVCTDEDVAILTARFRSTPVLKVPNVLCRDALPPLEPDGRFRILFVGNLNFSANVDGLRLFVDEGWPVLARSVPGATLDIVGLNPAPAVVELAERHGFGLHANVASLEPFYQACDVVIAPILFGSGTRIKILEAMAYGRPVVSTSMGAEGMGLEDGRHLLLADTMPAFAKALATLAAKPDLRETLAARARAFQQQYYTPPAINAAVTELLERGRARAGQMQAEPARAMTAGQA